MDKEKTILLVEDEAVISIIISKILKKFGYNVIAVNSGEKAIDQVLCDPAIDFVLMDIDLGKGIDGPDTARQILKIKNLPVVFLTAYAGENILKSIMGIPHYGFIIKNSDDFFVYSAIEMAYDLFESHQKIKDNERNYHEIFDSSGDALFIHDSATGEIIDVNRTMLEMYGYPDKNEVKGSYVEKFSAIGEGYNKEKISEMMEKAIQSDKNLFEWRAKKKNGEIFWVEVSLHHIQLGGEDRIVASVRDITKRKKAEEALIKSKSDLYEEQRFVKMLLDTSPAFIVAIDINGKTLTMNPALLNALEYGIDEIRGTDYITTFVPEEDRESLKSIFYKIISEGKNTVNENRIISKSGKTILVEWHGCLVKRGADDIDFFVGVGIDITKRKQTEIEMLATNEELTAINEEMEAANEELIAVNEELHRAEERYRGVVETQSEMIARFLDNGTITFVNRSWRRYYEELLGFTDDVIGKNISDLMQIKNYDTVHAYLDSLKPGEITSSMERSFVSLSGETRWQLWYIQKIINNTSRTTEFQVVGTDITERKLVENALRESEAKFKSVIELAPDAILMGSTTGVITAANQRAIELTGYSHDELIGRSINVMFSEEERKRVPLRYDLLQQGLIVRNERILTKKDGTEIFIEMNTKMMPDKTYQTFVRDVTEKHKLLDAVQRADKLNSLGVLAGGIAHDFNNLLSGIFGYVEMARMKSASDKTVSGYLDKAFTVFNRAKDLTQQLLTFSKGGTPVKKTGDIRTLIRESSSFALSGSNILCEYDFEETLSLCDFDENQIGQVIDNIVINSKQAMPIGGKIRISAENYSLPEGNNPILHSGDYIRISITDTGIGIPADLIKNIFDPFFTTKQQGNGLGLATCYSIIRKHDGYIEAESAPGEGTTFHILLPASRKEPASENPRPESYHKGSGAVLVMDDEDFILDIAGELLSQMGYLAVKAVNGEEALSLCSDFMLKGKVLTAALFDLTIPGGMGGKEIITTIKNIYPDLPVFATSGFSDDHIMSHPADYGFTASIQKPYRKADLVELFNRYLEK